MKIEESHAWKMFQDTDAAERQKRIVRYLTRLLWPIATVWFLGLGYIAIASEIWIIALLGIASFPVTWLTLRYTEISRKQRRAIDTLWKIEVEHPENNDWFCGIAHHYCKQTLLAERKQRAAESPEVPSMDYFKATQTARLWRQTAQNLIDAMTVLRFGVDVRNRRRHYFQQAAEELGV